LAHQEATFLASNQSEENTVLIEVASYLVDITVLALVCKIIIRGIPFTRSIEYKPVQELSSHYLPVPSGFNPWSKTPLCGNRNSELNEERRVNGLGSFLDDG